ncbi:MAG: UbiA family prenyltransferase [Candidatus Methanoperedens sp.]|nr:UbiA family prenyltransferase [Candidatus Methanoperedens sp.]CAG1009766.1 hypothetical protein METP1_03772 [Methanosarcinales archaeon]
MIKDIKNIIILGSPHYILLDMSTIFGTALFALGRLPDFNEWIMLLILFITGSIIMNGVDVAGHYTDSDVDKYQKPENPLQKGEINQFTMRRAVKYIYFLAVISLITMAVLTENLALILVAVAGWFFGHTYVTYPIRARANWLLASPWFSTGLAIIPLSGWILFRQEASIYIAAIFLLFFFPLMGEFLTKELNHLEYDSKGGLKTLPMVIGNNLTGILGVFFNLFSFIILTPIFYVIGFFNDITIILMLAPSLFAAVASAQLIRHPIKNAGSAQAWIKISIVWIGYALLISSLINIYFSNY